MQHTVSMVNWTGTSVIAERTTILSSKSTTDVGKASKECNRCFAASQRGIDKHVAF